LNTTTVNGTRGELQLNSNLGAHANLGLGDELEVKSFQISPTFHITCHVYRMAHLHFLSCQWSLNDTAKGKWTIQNICLAGLIWKLLTMGSYKNSILSRRPQDRNIWDDILKKAHVELGLNSSLEDHPKTTQICLIFGQS